MFVSGNQDLVVTVDSCYLNDIVNWIVDNCLSAEDNKVIFISKSVFSCRD